MKIRLLTLLAATLSTLPALARPGTLDVAPAKLLLLPHFEVDLDDPNNVNTSFVITNVSATATLVKVTLWTDLGVPVTSFSVYNTGYDVTEVDLRLLLAHGLPPHTATDGQDQRDDISPQGDFSQDINFASCTAGGAGYPSGTVEGDPLPPTTWSEARQARVRAALTGQPVEDWGGRCGGQDHGDGIARGYVTAELITSCNSLLPGDPGYWDNSWLANYLLGEFTIIHRTRGLGLTAPMAHVEAAQVGSRSLDVGLGTFYEHRGASGGQDRLEPLPSVWQVRHAGAGAGGAYGPLAQGQTHLLAWRDPGATVLPFTCGTLPAPFPLQTASVTSFDDQEEIAAAPNTLLPLVSNLVTLDAQAGIPHASGVLHVNLSHGTAPRGGYLVSTFTPDTGSGVALPAFGTGRSISGVITDVNRLVVAEGGTATFVITLVREPTQSVTIPLAVSDPTRASVPASVTIPPSSWFSGQTVQVNVGANDTADGPLLLRVELGATTSADPAFDGLDPLDVGLVVQDPDDVTITGPASVNEGETATFSITVRHAPAGEPNRQGAPTSLTVALHADTPARAAPGTPRTFLSFSGYPATQDLPVGALENATADGDATVTLTPVLVTDDPGFAGLTLPAITLTVVDND
ncbi:MAG: hypothetical protein AB2A00_01845 [Myxococcota bacterium]